MDLELRLVIYMLLVSSNMDFAVLNPIPMDMKNSHSLTKRQVVQPTWLAGPDRSRPKSIDPLVRVNEQNLREAEAIRKAIQATIDAGTFVVDPNQPSDDATDDKRPQMPPSFPTPPPPSPPPAPPSTDPMGEINRRWQEFLENSRRMWSWSA